MGTLPVIKVQHLILHLLAIKEQLFHKLLSCIPTFKEYGYNACKFPFWPLIFEPLNNSFSFLCNLNTNHLNLFLYINQVILLANFLVGFGWCKVIQEPFDNRTIQEDDNQAWRIQPDEDGNYRIDDMIMDEITFKRNFGTKEENAELDRQGLPKGVGDWPNNEVPYDFHSEVKWEHRQKVKAAIKDFNNQLAGCVKIRPRKSSEVNYVLVRTQDKGCTSWVGNKRWGYAQWLNLQPYYHNWGSDQDYCMWKGTIQHEFIHALGFFHVHSRPDRDKYVTVHMENVEKKGKHNFVKQTNADTFGVEYDARSFMHYWYRSWSNNGKPTITVKVSFKVYIDLQC